MTKEILKMVLIRFAKVWLVAFVVLLPAVPQDLSSIKDYGTKLGIAAIIAVFIAVDKLLRELAKSCQKN